MGISVADNFDHKSKKPLDARTSYATTALMKAVTDANINEGCLAYCAETDKYYKFLSSNTVDETLGKWREFETGGGGGGTSDYTDLENKPSINNVTLSGNKTNSDLGMYGKDDTAETTLADADYFPFYDVSASKMKKSLWSNIKSVLKTYFDSIYQKALTCLDNTISISSGVISAQSTVFSTTERAVGKWLGGQTIYQKTIPISAFPKNTSMNVAHGVSGNFTIIDFKAISTRTGYQYFVPFSDEDSATAFLYRNGANLVIKTNFDGSTYKGWVTIRYVKSDL